MHWHSFTEGKSYLGAASDGVMTADDKGSLTDIIYLDCWQAFATATYTILISKLDMDFEDRIYIG